MRAVRLSRLFTAALAVVFAVSLVAGGRAPEAAAQVVDPNKKIGDAVFEALKTQSEVRVVVALTAANQVRTSTAQVEPSVRTAEAASAQAAVRSAVSGTDFKETTRLQSLPIMGGLVNANGLQALVNHPGVLKIDLDLPGKGTLAQSVPLVNGDDWHVRGNRGQGVVVAVLDSGLDSTHSDVADGLIAEACFLNAVSGSKCPNNTDRQTGPGSAPDDFNHGTWVTGVIASNGNQAAEGMARDVQYVHVKVLDNTNSFSSSLDVIAGMDWVFTNRLDVQVMNMSLGTNALFTGDCDTANASTMAFATSINNLRTRATNPVLTVVSSGNQSSATQMAAPACVANAFSVGATTKADVVAAFSNASTTLDLLAPGQSIVTSQRGGGTASVDGTSFSAPHVTGCAALLIRGGVATTPATLETRLRTSAVQILDGRNGRTYPRLDCAPPTPGITVTETGGNTAVVEGGATDTFSVALDTIPVSDVTITPNPGTQVTVSPASRTFTQANFSTPQSFTVTAVDDNLIEGPHNQGITLVPTSMDSGYQGVTPPAVNVTIADNEAPPSVSINDVTVTEGDSGNVNATFSVVLTPASGQTVSITASTANGTATGGVDYIANTQTLTFTPGETVKQFTVPVAGETLPEGTETFFVNLTSPVNTTIGDGQGLGTITDNDVPDLRINDVTVNEGGDRASTTVTFTVSLSGGSTIPVNVTASTTDGTAAAPTDYASKSQTLTFAPGELSKQFTVTVNGDDSVEPDETFFVNLTSPVTANIADNQGVGTIRNDDEPGSFPANNNGSGDKKDKDEKEKPTEDERRQSQYTNTSGHDDHHVQGTIVSWEPGPYPNTLLVTVATGPGGSERIVVLIPCEGSRCPEVHEHWELEADGDLDVWFEPGKGTWRIGPPEP